MIYFILIFLILIFQDLRTTTATYTLIIYLYKIAEDLSLAYLLFTLLALTKKPKWILLIFVTLYSIYSAIVYLYVRVFGFTFRIQQFMLLNEMVSLPQFSKLPSITSSLWSLLPILIVILAIVFKLLDKKITLPKKRVRIPLLISSFFLFALLNFSVVASENPYHIPDWGIPEVINYDIKESVISLTDTASIKQEEIDDFIKKYSKQEENEYTGYFKGKNLVLVLCESLDESVIDEKINLTLYKVYNDSWKFKNYHGPLYEYHTIDAEFSVLTGMAPSLDLGVTNYLYYKNSYPSSLANLLKKQGYKANSYHNFRGSYYNRYIMHKALGFESYTAVDDFIEKVGLHKDQNEIDVMIQDHHMMENIPAKESPYFDFIITLSMHGWYLLDEEVKMEDSIKNLNTNDEFKEYLRRSRYFDKAIETLLKSHEEKGDLQNTVFVFFADHYPYEMINEENVKNILSDDYIPFFIYAPGEEPKTIEKECSLEDIYPTITNLFGLDTSKYYKAGVDIFSTTPSHLLNFKLQKTDEKEKQIQDEIKKYSQAILSKDYYAN